MATSDELALVDANVLVYGFYDQAEHYPECSRLLERAQDCSPCAWRLSR
jgi:hypothetical protein